REDGGIGSAKEVAERVVFELSVVAAAVKLEDGAEAHARGLLDEAVELDEGNAQSLGELGAERALSGAAQANQSDDGLWGGARCRRVAEEFDDGRPERVGEVREACDRDVGLAVFELNQEALAEAGKLRELANGHAEGLPSRADGTGEGGEQALTRAFVAES